MLSAEDNELLTRVGRGTPMGNLLRRYWIPFLLAADVEADGPPERVKLLGEDLLAFRDSSGAIGLVQEHCPHRRASLYFGRNEECGLRCIYHGWKFDVAGACVEQPSEPDASNFREKIHLTAYPCVERGGFVWTYMGPQPAPELPHFEWMDLPEDHHVASMRVQYTNWVQALEGEFDQSHVSYLHSRLAVEAGKSRSLVDSIRSADRHPVFDVINMPYGTCIAAGRVAPDDRRYWRVTQHLMPFFALTGPYGPNPHRPWRAWIPLDDTSVVVAGLRYHPLRALTGSERSEALTRSTVENIAPEALAPRSSKPYGRYRPLPSIDDDFRQDREVQRTQTYSGIPDFWAQDAAMQVSMGAVCDRSEEHLGTSDQAIIAIRKRLITAAKELRDDGIVPVEIANPNWYQVRSDAVIVPANEAWFTATEQRRLATPGVNPDTP